MASRPPRTPGPPRQSKRFLYELSSKHAIILITSEYIKHVMGSATLVIVLILICGMSSSFLSVFATAGGVAWLQMSKETTASKGEKAQGSGTPPTKRRYVVASPVPAAVDVGALLMG